MCVFVHVLSCYARAIKSAHKGGKLAYLGVLFGGVPQPVGTTLSPQSLKSGVWQEGDLKKAVVVNKYV